VLVRQPQVLLYAAEVEVGQETIEASRRAVQVGIVADLLEPGEMHPRLPGIELPGVHVKHDGPSLGVASLHELTGNGIGKDSEVPAAATGNPAAQDLSAAHRKLDDRVRGPIGREWSMTDPIVGVESDRKHRGVVLDPVFGHDLVGPQGVAGDAEGWCPKSAYRLPRGLTQDRESVG
jgi:hypothetical protein